MAKTYTFYPTGICPNQFEISVEGGRIADINIFGGCNGNLKGISRLITGLDARDVIELMEGITCGSKETSCPDQISRALREILEEETLM